MNGSGAARRWSRRRFCTALAIPAGAQVKRLYPSERRRFLDPATEFEIARITEPTCSSFLPPSQHQAVSRRGAFLLYASDRGGTLQAYTMDLKTWESRQVTEARALDRESLTLTPDERDVCYLDGRTVWLSNIRSGRGKLLYEFAGGDEPGPGLTVTPDGPSALITEKRGRTSRLLMVSLPRGTAGVVAEGAGEFSYPMPRPRRAAVAYRVDREQIWLAHFDGSRNYRLKTAPDGTGPALWAPDGRTILYLNYPDEPGKAHALRELDPDTGEDKLIASTSQFVAFSCNRDASVFVGASGSRASPYLLLLVRVAKRELTLCEHRSSDPTSAAPLFSPDSQRVFFQSDRHGKPALYQVPVERLVEKTES